MKTMRALVSAVALLLLIVGCKRTPEASLAGHWQEIKGSDTVDFQPDGKFNAHMKAGMNGGTDDLTGKYFVSGDSISIDLGDNSPMTWKFQQSDDQLVVTYTAGGRVKMDGGMAHFKHTG
jgi:hypothetical protein